MLPAGGKEGAPPPGPKLLLARPPPLSPRPQGHPPALSLLALSWAHLGRLPLPRTHLPRARTQRMPCPPQTASVLHFHTLSRFTPPASCLTPRTPPKQGSVHSSEMVHKSPRTPFPPHALGSLENPPGSSDLWYSSPRGFLEVSVGILLPWDWWDLGSTGQDSPGTPSPE